MATQVVSRSDLAKGEVLEAIRQCGGYVEAATYHELRKMLGLEHISKRVMRSALWKLVRLDHKLAFRTKRDEFWNPHSGETEIEAYCYRLA